MAFLKVHGDSARVLRSGVSFIAICAFAAAAPAVAQTTKTTTNPKQANPNLSNTVGQTQQSNQAPAPSDTISNSTTAPTPPPASSIVITGIRQSLANAQNIKRNSD